MTTTYGDNRIDGDDLLVPRALRLVRLIEELLVLVVLHCLLVGAPLDDLLPAPLSREKKMKMKDVHRN